MFQPSQERLQKECSIWLSCRTRKQWVPMMFDRQFEVFNTTKRAVLVSGPRKSGKTWAVLHKIVRHLWDTPGARVAMFSKTLKNAKDGGTWDDINKIVMPEWINSGIGIQYTTVDANGVPGPKVDGQTRTPFFRVKNRFGGESECKLFSLDYTHDVEDKVKEQRFSMIYFSELAKFEDRKVLSIALPQLRMPHLRPDQQQWIADTNPSEEGEESWIYKVWYEERLVEYENYVDTCKKQGQRPMDRDVFQNFQSGLELIEIKPEENPFLDPMELLELKSTYAYDNDLYARYVDGKWLLGKGAAGRHFAGYFFERQHVLGNAAAADPSEWITILPAPVTQSLITGWDLGETNHAAAIIDKVGVRDKFHYHVLDELVFIKREVSVPSFTTDFLSKIDDLERICGRKFSLDKNWSDRSSIEKYSSAADSFQYLEVLAASKGRIYLSGVIKGAGSVRQRVRIMKRLLHEKRFKVSAHCIFTIEMLKNLRKGDTEDDYVISDRHKHIFDAITYALLMEMMEELEAESDGPTMGNRPGLSISVKM